MNPGIDQGRTDKMGQPINGCPDSKITQFVRLESTRGAVDDRVSSELDVANGIFPGPWSFDAGDFDS